MSAGAARKGRRPRPAGRDAQAPPPPRCPALGVQRSNVERANVERANVQRANVQRANVQRANVQRANVQPSYSSTRP
jgi:uncharacterized protein YjbI with pentapeptide repeats